jgi:hypothetical protein
MSRENPLWGAPHICTPFVVLSGSIFLKPAHGAGSEEAILKLNRTPSPSSWSRDGRILMLTVPDAKTRRDLWVLPMDGEHQPAKFETEFNEASAQFSPEPGGPKYAAYISDESGKDQGYVNTFPDRSLGKWPIFTNGGVQPRWRRDGKDLLYFTPDGKLMIAGITMNP